MRNRLLIIPFRVVQPGGRDPSSIDTSPNPHLAMKLYRTSDGLAVETSDGDVLAVEIDINDIFTAEDPLALITRAAESARPSELTAALAPIDRQEVWGAGVTYFRSRTARMAESEHAGGGSFYDRVYSAERPEIFFKCTPSRVADAGGFVRVRSDSSWTVPEPELALAITSAGRHFGYTIGNDMSARDIEGENPLYLPQAKTYAGSCSIGPCILLTDDPLPSATEIVLEVDRDGEAAYRGSTTLESMKRTVDELIDFLFRDNVFPDGCVLLTGTGIIPPDDFSLRAGDEIAITVEPIGTLVNRVA